MIDVVGVTKTYGATTAVDDVSVRAQPGGVTYLLGPNGDMVEVGSLAALSSVSTRFLYYIKPEFR